MKQFSAGDDWMPFGFLRAPNGRRASGMMISPIHFAGYLEAIGIVGLSMVFWSTWRGWVRGLTAYVVVMCYVGVALSGSRGGYLSSAFSLVMFALISLWALRRAAPQRFRGAALATLIGLLAFAGLAFFGIRQSADLSKRLDNLFGTRETAHDVRIYNWQAALDQFRVSPVVGTGAGTHLYYGRLFRRPQLQADPEHAHCDYLELLAEYGIVGAAGMTAFLFFHIASLLRAVARNTATPTETPFESCRDNRLAIQIGVLSAIAAYLAHSVVDFNLHIPANALLFAFLFGMAANPQSTAAEPDAPLRTVRAFQLALPALGAWILASGFPKLPAEDLTEKARIAVRNKNTSRPSGSARASWHGNGATRFSISPSETPIAGWGVCSGFKPCAALIFKPPWIFTKKACSSFLRTYTSGFFWGRPSTDCGNSAPPKTPISAR